MGQGYSCLKLDLATVVSIQNAVMKMLSEEDNKNDEVLKVINIPSDELHCTLMYDKRDPEINPGANNKTYKCKLTGVEKLGTVGGKYYSMVLILESEEVQQRHQDLLAKGYQHSFPDLLLHVSLNYGSDVDVMFPHIKAAFDKGLLPKVVHLGMETWNKCK